MENALKPSVVVIPKVLNKPMPRDLWMITKPQYKLTKQRKNISVLHWGEPALSFKILTMGDSEVGKAL